MNPSGIKGLSARHSIKFVYYTLAHAKRISRTYDSEMIATVAYTDIEPLLDLFEVFIELAAKISQRIIVSGFQQELPGFVSSVQKLTVFVLTVSGSLRL